MRIEIQDAANHFAEQTRFYAEYRVFSALVNIAPTVRDATVRLSRARDDEIAGEHERVRCSASIRLEAGDQVDLTTGGPHPYAAIDRLARRITVALDTDPATAHADSGP